MIYRYLVLFLVGMFAISYSQYSCPWNTFSNGGGTLTSTDFQGQATIGQTAIGNLSSSNILAKIGFWYPLPLTGITEQKDDEIFNTNSLITKLYNAFPNPFKSQTTIRYSLSNSSKLSLVIYDASGRIIRKLINQEIPAGIYTINWNGTDDRGQKIASGIYFYKLQTPDHCQVKKLLLL